MRHISAIQWNQRILRPGRVRCRAPRAKRTTPDHTRTCGGRIARIRMRRRGGHHSWLRRLRRRSVGRDEPLLLRLLRRRNRNVRR